MTNDDFIVRLIGQLRAPGMIDFPHDSARRLADHLEMRITQPLGDGFDIVRTGDEKQDRLALAAWLEAGAHAGPYLAPPWGRTFSEAMAWLVRNNHGVRIESVLVAFVAGHDLNVARIANDQGIDAAYASIPGLQR
jgi:hypothetical protein